MLYVCAYMFIGFVVYLFALNVQHTVFLFFTLGKVNNIVETIIVHRHVVILFL